MALIETFELCKYYENGTIVKAIDGINLKIEKREFTSIVGPSGSGKTTLLNLLGGIDRPTKGKVILDGIEISSLSERRLSELRLRKIGFVFQSFNLIPVLTAFENVEFVLILRGFSKKERREKVMKVLKDVGLEKLADRPLTKLSGGEQQRVAVARAIVGEPKIVLADEPTANLDSENAIALVELMKKLNEEKGITFILSTHDNRVVERTKRIIKLVDGKIIQS
ncbi:ABC transporter ATP-binding protein [Candidatus Aminicenantes bacterium AC-708-M15]|jgi:putative ABC transport system ATP-binding protein|nr:ABC transporter ATP-binding protein [SCandidatus Aminicenantes bacterium Aminicenantia_JdfR_composite]MCP2596646.1 ABC transporter ATP-binding protein [Candidatus Aminicenantes bacterium AC-335-G13]MCP2598217.1 ABC transporter ATP-binding protein [Candidatus Aminicenantes bacterium AC-335-L06]MCP2603950.1 ABC transporter ATP-binding protein [Candidatus Aminicenantes bacterium AC-708-M15]MCP2605594.1 ABC transporter ATP-binding protein [Candidatus Aminicenantes bacterium AC-335-O07]MCP260663